MADAHRQLRAGKIDGAIAAYAGLIEERPDDWTAANRLGDLYMQTGKIQEAVGQFTQVAQHLLERDLLPKAAALYKKVLGIVPEDEHARMQLADIAERQGFLVDAVAHLTAFAEQRRQAGDDAGAAEVERRIEDLSHTGSGDGMVAHAPPAVHSDQNSNDNDQWQINNKMLYQPAPTAATVPAPDDTTTAAAPKPMEDAQPTAVNRQLQLKLMLVENEMAPAGSLGLTSSLLPSSPTSPKRWTRSWIWPSRRWANRLRPPLCAPRRSWKRGSEATIGTH